MARLVRVVCIALFQKYSVIDLDAVSYFLHSFFLLFLCFCGIVLPIEETPGSNRVLRPAVSP